MFQEILKILDLVGKMLNYKRSKYNWVEVNVANSCLSTVYSGALTFSSFLSAKLNIVE